MALWVDTNEALVTTQAMPIAWTAMDLSSWVGAKPSLVLLRIKPSVAAANQVGFRPNGDADNWQTAGSLSDGQGTCHVTVDDTYGDPFVFVPTDVTGQVQWKANVGAVVSVYIIGYLYDHHSVATNLHNGALPLGWTVLNAGLSATSVVFLKDKQNAGMAAGVSHILRPKDDTTDWIIDSLNERAPGNKCGTLNINGTAGLVTKTNSTGKIDLYADSAATNSTIDLLAYISYGENFYAPFYGEEIVFPFGPSPDGVYADLDLSDAIGEREALVFLEVYGYGTALGPSDAGFRKNGSGTNADDPYGVNSVHLISNGAGLVIVNTDSDGVVEWTTKRTGTAPQFGVTVIGFIPTAQITDWPELVSVKPAGVTTTEPSSIEAVIYDPWGITLNTINLTLLSPTYKAHEAIVAGVVQSGYTGYISGISSNRHVTVVLTSWPDTVMKNGERWSFELEATNTVLESF